MMLIAGSDDCFETANTFVFFVFIINPNFSREVSTLFSSNCSPASVDTTRTVSSALLAIAVADFFNLNIRVFYVATLVT